MAKTTKDYEVVKLPAQQLVAVKKDLPPSGAFPPDSERFEDLKKSLQRHGMLLPVFVAPDKTILSGHYRYWAARSLKWKEVPAVVIDAPDAMDAHKEILAYLETQGSQ